MTGVGDEACGLGPPSLVESETPRIEGKEQEDTKSWLQRAILESKMSMRLAVKGAKMVEGEGGDAASGGKRYGSSRLKRAEWTACEG